MNSCKCERNSITALLFLILLPFISLSQDTLKTLNAEQTLKIVRTFHPVVRQAAIGVERSKAEWRAAKGQFDPILSAYSARKTFDGTDYYSYNTPEIRIPTWYGIEFYAGLENLTGSRLDPTQTTGETSYAGVSIPLVKDLVMNKRRATLQQARIFRDLAEVQQRATINDLLMQSMEAYWYWVETYQVLNVITKNVDNNLNRLNMVRQTCRLGERPAIDTVEALTQLQSFQYLRNRALLEFRNAGLKLSVFLWRSNDEPYVLPVSVVPEDTWEQETRIERFNLSLNNLLDAALENHPDLNAYDYKLDILDVEKKLKFQSLLPKVNLSYNQLGKGYDLVNTSTSLPLFQNNYQYGLKMEMPLRLSEGRGGYRSARLKIEETRLDQFQKKQHIELKVRSYYNEFMTTREQVILQTGATRNYQELVDAEVQRYSNGESSLFLINSRENKALEAQEKLIEAKAKYFKTLYALQWSAGLLN